MSSSNADHDKTTEAPAIGDRIRRFRNERGLSLTELAEVSGVSKSHLSAIENGTGSRPGAAILHKLATALGVTLADVLGRRVLPDSDLTIPDSLRDFAQEQGLPEADIRMLAAIKFRGEQPKTAQRWGFIYNAIKNSTGMDTQR
jgi:transcriptional regulator with XRE-family HTH domain